MEENIILKIENLKSGYDRHEIIHGVDIKVRRGEIVALVGLNGSGKSTILRSIFNLVDVYSGKIIYNNKKIAKLPAHELIKMGISYIPQGRQIFPDMTVEDNIEMGAYIINDKNLLKDLKEKIFARFPFLKKKKNDYAFTLSGGQQQILSFARALILQPRLLLLDEPFLGLSSSMVEEIFSEIKKINNSGISIIIVEHNIKIVSSMADRVYTIKDGNIVL